MPGSQLKNVGVIGAGTMGSGIAMVIALAGYSVKLTDIEESALRTALQRIESNSKWMLEQGLIKKEQIGALTSGLATTTDRSRAVRGADYVIEAVFEDPKTKKSIFQDLDNICPEHTILATNTSSISLNEIASVTKRQDRCVGMHWWNPPHIMPLVEVVRGAMTSENAVQTAKALAQSVGKTPVVCKDSPGLLGVRIQAALVTESIRVLEEGLATPDEIDTAVRLTLGLRLPVIGPLRIVDLGGVDVFNDAYDYLAKKLGERFEPPGLLKDSARSGKLGVKTGEGFYSYGVDEARAISKERDEWTAKRLRELRGSQAQKKA